MTALLELNGISKSYGASRALRDVSLILDYGQSVAVIGENGAGKSTLGKILAGVVRPDAGGISLEGVQATLHSPRDALQRGVSFIPQELAYFPNLSVAENVLVGRWPRRYGLTSVRAAVQRATEEFRRFGVDIDPRRPMSALKLADRQLVEIVKALARRAKLIVLDEPTASLAEHESDNLFRVLRALNLEGVGSLFISHRIDEVRRFGDRVLVLRNGEVVASVAPADTSARSLIGHMLGRDPEEVMRSTVPSAVHEQPLLELEDWRKQGFPALLGMNLTLVRGELVALFGLRGSGAELIAEGLAGLRPDIKGALRLRGKKVRIFSSPLEAKAAGLAYVPAERKRDGLVLSLPIYANIGLLVLSRLSRFGVLWPKKERALAHLMVSRLQIRYRHLTQLVSELSGGNQQKVMVGSRLALEPALLVLHEPTRGVDVGARIEIHQLLREMAARGTAILLVTSDAEEAVSVSDRVIVIRDGLQVADLSGAVKTQAQALAFATREVA